MKKNIYSILILLSIFFVFSFVLAKGQSKLDIVETLPESSFILPLSNQTLKEEISIKLKVKDALTIEFYVRRSGALTSIYLGQAVKQGEQIWQYSWQTENYPNGEHKLYAQINNEYGSYESSIIEVTISNPSTSEVESKDKVKEIIKEKKEIENKNKEEKSEKKDELKEEIKDKTINFKKEIEVIVKEKESKEISHEEKNDIEKSINQDVLPEIEKLDDKIKEITVAQNQLEQLEVKEKQEEKQEEIKKKLVQLTEEKKEIKENIVKKTEKILEKEEIKLEVGEVIKSQPVKKAEVLVKKEIIKQNITQQVENLDQSLSSKEKENQYKLKEMEEIDNDKDGIPDVEEIRLGTNLLSPDTDGDGYLDKDEIEHGYDPLTPSPGDKIVFEEPREKGEVKEEYQVASVEAKELEDKTIGILLTGKGLPNSFVTIYIYSSLPIVVVAKTDENGNWSYLLDKQLEDGEHQVYVTVTNNKGEINYKSEPKYFIKQAQAVTAIAASSIFDKESSGVIDDNQEPSRTGYLILGLSIISFCAGIALMIIGRRVLQQKSNK